MSKHIWKIGDKVYIKRNGVEIDTATVVCVALDGNPGFDIPYVLPYVLQGRYRLRGFEALRQWWRRVTA